MPLLLLSNPPKSRRRRRRSRARRRARVLVKKVIRRRRRRATVARRRRRPAVRRAVVDRSRRFFRRRRRSAPRRRPSRRSGGGLSLGGRGMGGFITKDLVMGAAGAGGFIGTAWVLSKLDKDRRLEGWSLIGAKVVAAIALGWATRKWLRMPGLATGLMIGGLTSAGLDVYNRLRSGDGTKKGYGIDGPDSLPYSDNYQLGEASPGETVVLSDGRVVEIVGDN